MKALPLALCAALATAAPAVADEGAQPPVMHVVKDSFDNVSFAVQNAIVDAGLVVDHISRPGDMLARTKKDVGGKKDLFIHADSYGFCSAQVSREVMAANLQNIQYCPYSIFIYQTPDKPDEVVVGHRNYPGESMKPVNAMLDKIIADALSN